MVSTYTANTGIEKPAQGDQAGEWGDTVNTNMDILDRAINGVATVTLSGTTHTLTTTDGALSEGGNKVLVLGGSPGGTNTITISPNDQDKLYFVVNSSGQSAIFSQGSGANATITNGSSAIIYADGAGSGAAVTAFNSTLQDEAVQDIVGGMVTSNTETGIAVTYEDGDGTLDFVVSDTTVAGDSGSTGMTPGDTLTIAGGTNVTTAMSGDTLTITSTDTNTQLSQENVEDYVGGMVTGNTETGISVTYEDGDGTLDFVVSDTTVAGDSGSTGMTPGDTLTIAGGTNITTAMSGDTLTVTNDIVYETGTATLTLTGSSGAPTSAVTATANYVKVGKMITVDVVFNGVSMSGSSGGVRITGLPYAVASVGVATSLQHGAEVNGAYNVWYINSTNADLYTVSDAAGWAAAPVTSGTVYHFQSFTYRTAA